MSAWRGIKQLDDGDKDDSGIIMPVAVAFMLIGLGTASADCAAKIAKLGGGISKDGSMAPLQGTTPAPPAAAEGASAPAEEAVGEVMGDDVAKDGTEEPLGASPDIATSAQDAASQSAGGDTATAQATGEGHAADGKQAALAKAQAALDAGDEAACMEAISAM